MSDWFIKDRYLCNGPEVQFKLDELANSYLIEFVASHNKAFLKDNLYAVEIWVNVNSGVYIANIYTTTQEIEDKEIKIADVVKDADFKEIEENKE